MITKGRKEGTLRFKFASGDGVEHVCVTGTFTSWVPKKMRRLKDGSAAVTLPVSSGRHQYKFIVDGEWLTDPDNPLTEPNTFGTLNSVVEAG